jgi:hypothetical protein
MNTLLNALKNTHNNGYRVGVEYMQERVKTTLLEWVQIITDKL